MAENYYEVEGRTFRNKPDYERALRDKKTIDTIRDNVDWNNKKQVELLYKELKAGKIRFFTLLGVDFTDEVESRLFKKNFSSGKKTDATTVTKNSADVEREAVRVLKRRERSRQIISVLCTAVAAACVVYLGFYSWQHKQVQNISKSMSDLKEKPPIASYEESPSYSLEQSTEKREVLDEYKNLLIKNKKLIGWVKIDDTYIDYPVVQTYDNEYFLDHNVNLEYDKNGSIFLDKDCDIEKPSTNLIIYGHHMKSGAMFGSLNKYEDKEYYEKHPFIKFDTIYEKGIYQIMYVFRSKVYREDEIVFKYYQFIDSSGEQEFLSNMSEMENLSLYDTGVTAEYGDRLLTLSTCDYQEKNGRFVVVAKKIKE